MSLANLSTHLLTFLFLSTCVLGFLFFLFLQKQNNFAKNPLTKNRTFQLEKWKYTAQFTLIWIAVFSLAFAVLQPQWGYSEQEENSKGIQIIFSLDVSKSMNAEDLGPISRLHFSKNLIQNFVSQHPENAYGLVIFSGEAITATPLTSDANSFLFFLSNVDNEDVQIGGTSISTALSQSLAAFNNAEEKGRAVIFISDGAEELEDSVSPILQDFKEAKIPIFSLGIGSKDGGKIPIGTDLFGQKSFQTFQGSPVIAKLNEETLKTLVNKTGGIYFTARSATDIDAISNALEKVNKISLEQNGTIKKEERFQLFLGISLLCLLFASLLSYKTPFFLLGLLMFSSCSVQEKYADFLNQQGNKAFEQSYLSEAEAKYIEAQKTFPEHSAAKNNQALEAYEKQDFEKATEQLKNTTNNCKKELCNQVFYNLGNSLFRQGEQNKIIDIEATKKNWKEAIEAYKESLKYKQEQRTEENLQFVEEQLQKLLEQEKQQKEQQEQSDEQQNSEEQNQEQQNSDESDNSKEGENKSEEKTNYQDVRPSDQKPSDWKEGEQKMSEQQEQQAHGYQKDLEQQEQQLQKFFRPFNQEEANKPSDPFGIFNDPFFQDFFGIKQNPFFQKDKDNGVEKDW